ncbi:hypothetical protein OMP40_39225 [Cohnella rhizosphaerae]|uniref:Uncharacterized protein n=1 Tax=Cohnella rhizosphaerae TaxID=1457232 RepID=A0A9X4L1Z6_9BACL|nr:hypothetical protein [Cohnella rhizosphaerae]MDG0814651.1 hypothetical protein [Cohnella rhizosphaerae]
MHMPVQHVMQQEARSICFGLRIFRALADRVEQVDQKRPARNVVKQGTQTVGGRSRTLPGQEMVIKQKIGTLAAELKGGSLRGLGHIRKPKRFCELSAELDVSP